MIRLLPFQTPGVFSLSPHCKHIPFVAFAHKPYHCHPTTAAAAARLCVLTSREESSNSRLGSLRSTSVLLRCSSSYLNFLYPISRNCFFPFLAIALSGNSSQGCKTQLSADQTLTDTLFTAEQLAPNLITVLLLRPQNSHHENSDRPQRSESSVKVCKLHVRN